jgi:hypothetical protein
VSIGAYDLIQLPASGPIQRIPMQKTEACNCGNGTPPARERAGRYRSSECCERDEFRNYCILDRS